MSDPRLCKPFWLFYSLILFSFPVPFVGSQCSNWYQLYPLELKLKGNTCSNFQFSKDSCYKIHNRWKEFTLRLMLFFYLVKFLRSNKNSYFALWSFSTLLYYFRLYFTKIGLGSPPKDYYVQVDTGSDILWVNCAGCTSCPKKSDLGVCFQNPTSWSYNLTILCNLYIHICVDLLWLL